MIVSNQSKADKLVFEELEARNSIHFSKPFRATSIKKSRSTPILFQWLY